MPLIHKTLPIDDFNILLIPTEIPNPVMVHHLNNLYAFTVVSPVISSVIVPLDPLMLLSRHPAPNLTIFTHAKDFTTDI